MSAAGATIVQALCACIGSGWTLAEDLALGADTRQDLGRFTEWYTGADEAFLNDDQSS